MNAEIYNTAEQLVGLLKEKKLLIATAEILHGRTCFVLYNRRSRVISGF